MSKVIFITGASSGIGKAIGDFLTINRFKVYGTSRNSSNYLNSKFELLDLDVKNLESINSCVDKIIKIEGKIDVLINNAGVGITGPLEEIPEKEIENNFKTNLFGPINVMKCVLPKMRSKNQGLIINITSVAAYVGTPYRSIYSAAKSALDLVSETLNMETKPFNIKVVTIAPGDFATNIASRRYHAPNEEKSAYFSGYSKALRLMNEHVDSGSDPLLIAKLIFKIIKTKNPNKKYTVGSFLERMAPYLKLLLPQKLFEYIVMKSY
jgi:short-subunit dehydrogenase